MANLTPDTLTRVIDALEAKLAETRKKLRESIDHHGCHRCWSDDTTAPCTCEQERRTMEGVYDALAPYMNALPEMLAAARGMVAEAEAARVKADSTPSDQLSIAVHNHAKADATLRAVAAILEPFARQFGVWGE